MRAYSEPRRPVRESAVILGLTGAQGWSRNRTLGSHARGSESRSIAGCCAALPRLQHVRHAAPSLATWRFYSKQKGTQVNCIELVEQSVSAHNLSKAYAARVLETMTGAIVAAVKKGGSSSDIY